MNLTESCINLHADISECVFVYLALQIHDENLNAFVLKTAELCYSVIIRNITYIFCVDKTWSCLPRGLAKGVIGARNGRKCMMEKQFQTNKFSVYTEGVYDFRR